MAGDEILKIAVVGLGNRGPQHLCTIVGLKDRYRLVGVCDLVPEKREAAAAKFGAPGFASAEEMLDAARPDLVIFTVSPRDLPNLVKLAADRKIHVATETPLAPTLPEADLLIETARRGGIKIENFEQVCAGRGSSSSAASWRRASWGRWSRPAVIPTWRPTTRWAST